MAAKFVLPRTSVILNQAYWKAVCAGLNLLYALGRITQCIK